MNYLRLIDEDTIELILSGVVNEAGVNVEIPAGGLLDQFGNPSRESFSVSFHADIGRGALASSRRGGAARFANLPIRS